MHTAVHQGEGTPRDIRGVGCEHGTHRCLYSCCDCGYDQKLRRPDTVTLSLSYLIWNSTRRNNIKLLFG